jgi:predicted RNA-binding protein YlqC (UPF0109 family)
LTNVRNPVAESLRRNIRDHEESLALAVQALGTGSVGSNDSERRDSTAKTQLFLVQLAQILVVDGSSVRVEAKMTEAATALRLHAAPADLGKLIGEQGRTARSLRVVIEAIGVTQGIHYTLEIVEPS